MRPARHRRVRLYQLLRTAHLERAHQSTAASIIYLDRRYDFDADVARGLDLIRGGTVTAAVSLLRSRVVALEVLEPLMRHGLLRTAVGVAAVKISARLARRPLVIATYAIENRDPYATDPTAVLTLRSRGRRTLDLALTRWVSRQIDRMAFGTPGAQHLYERTLARDLDRTRTELIPALPASCDCAAGNPGSKEGVVFLGAFEERKGVRQLLTAWGEVSRLQPEMRLTMIGKGAMEDEVLQFARSTTGVTVVLDPPRDAIHAALARSRTLILLSQPHPRWREQVGLPIVEALAHGCSVVTTTETGLADWLAEHRHGVVEPATLSNAIARVIVEVYQRGPSASEITGSLPQVDGRLAADRWMLDANGPGDLPQ